MNYRTLGGTGIQVTPYTLGAMMFGAIGNPDHDESVRIIHRALDAGINTIDTADMYSHGESEQIVAKALRGRRDDVVLATKAGLPWNPDDPNTAGGSRRWLTTAVENSLRRLETDYIDVYQLHRPDPRTDLEETIATLTDLQRAGKIRAFGGSSYPASWMVEAQWTAERHGLARMRTEQPTYSILNRGIEAEVLPTAQRYGLGVFVYSPLAGGLLTGRYRKGQQNTDSHRAQFGFSYLSQESRLDAAEAVITLAGQAGLEPTHLAMAFTIAHPGVTSALIGPRTMDHLESTLAGVDVVLDDDLLDQIDQIVAPGTDVGTFDPAFVPPSISEVARRRRPVDQRPAATAE